MKRHLTLAAALTVAVACGDHVPLAPTSGPSMMISDGVHNAGNPDFFFLPPMVPDPSKDPRFEPGQFNPNLSPVVEVCAWSGSACGATVAQFTMTSGLGSEVIRVNTTDQDYVVNWHTDLSNLDPATTYRIRVRAGGTELGSADLDVVSSAKELRNVQTGEYIGLVDGRTLPIKFRIENGALCDPPGTEPCGSGTVNLAAGGAVVVEETGDRIDIPPQTGGGPVATITIQYCDGINVDVPTFGPCLGITSDPPDLTFSPRATVSVCSLPVPPLPAAQRDLVTLYRRHGDQLMALPHAHDHCETTVGAAPAPPRNLAEAGWRLLQRAAATLFGPPRLYASAPVLHLGAGGDTPGESNFQFGLPAMMAPLPNTQGQTAAPGDTVPYPPGVIVTDTSGGPVSGATIHFTVTQGGGTVVPESVVTDTLGIAMVTNWTLGSPGANQLRAWAIGIRGPADTFTVVPDTLPVTADTGQVLFNAGASTGVPSGWVLYGVNSGDDGLSRIDVATGAVTFIARLNPDLTKWTTPVAMSTRIPDSTLFVWNNSDQVTTGVLLTVDRCTGRGTPVDSTTPPQGPLQALAMSPTDTLYGLESELYRISTTTGTKTLIASMGIGRVFGADFLGSTLYAVTQWDTLYTINTSTGVATRIGALSPSPGIPGSLVADPATGHQIGSAFGGTFGDILFDLNPATAAVSNIRSLSGGSAPQGMGFGPPCPPAPPAPQLDSARFNATDTLVIEGPAVGYTAFMRNPGTSTLSNVAMQGWIYQGAALRAAGGALVSCGAGLGDLPPGTCNGLFSLLASNTTSGTGTLVPGVATAKLVLEWNSAEVDTAFLPVVLVAGPKLAVDSVHLATDSLRIGGPAVSYTAFITNKGSTTVSNVTLQTWIDQGGASRAGGGLLTDCTSTLGDVPPGTCAVTFTLLASNATAGTGTLVPGLATARFELNQGGPAFGALNRPVYLVP